MEIRNGSQLWSTGKSTDIIDSIDSLVKHVSFWGDDIHCEVKV